MLSTQCMISGGAKWFVEVLASACCPLAACSLSPAGTWPKGLPDDNDFCFPSYGP